MDLILHHCVVFNGYVLTWPAPCMFLGDMSKFQVSTEHSKNFNRSGLRKAAASNSALGCACILRRVILDMLIRVQRCTLPSSAA
jgi:hypothetical protein